MERKVTYVLERFWPALFGAAMGRDLWQTKGLTPEAKKLLKRVDREGSIQLVRADKAARLLERRLLVYTMNVHTDSGAHALVLLGWDALAKQIGWTGTPIPSSEGRAELDAAARVLARI